MKNFEVAPDNAFECEGITVAIAQDDLGWDLMGDEPVDIIGVDGWGRDWVLHAGGANVPDLATLKMIRGEDWEGIVDAMAYDSEQREGRVVVWPDWHDRAVTFKNWRNAALGMLRREGIDLDDIRIEEISPQYHQTSDTFIVVWSQRQFDQWAGTKGAAVFTKEYEAILSGDVWWISATDQDDLAEGDSCAGLIGEYWSDYIQGEARQMLESVLAEKREALAQAMAADIQNARPDLCTA